MKAGTRPSSGEKSMNAHRVFLHTHDDDFEKVLTEAVSASGA
jgi:hypothetical protein